jgi:acylphosphatase
MMTVRVIISGRVQGVGYRAWTEKTARKLGLNGWVRNRQDGTVEAVFCGGDARVAEIAEACKTGPMLARVTRIEQFSCEENPVGFTCLPTV